MTRQILGTDTRRRSEFPTGLKRNGHLKHRISFYIQTWRQRATQCSITIDRKPRARVSKDLWQLTAAANKLHQNSKQNKSTSYFLFRFFRVLLINCLA